MLGKIMRLATITSLLAISLTGASLAVELRNTPYLPSLKPSTPPILGSNNSLNRPSPRHIALLWLNHLPRQRKLYFGKRHPDLQEWRAS